MSTFPNSPQLIKGALVLVDPESSKLLRTIRLQYNPESLSRTLQVQGVGDQGGDRMEALRLTGPPVETIKLDAVIDATDQLEHPGENPNAAALGIHPQLAALETLVYPASDDIKSAETLAQMGTLEIAPMEAAMTLFVWSKTRVVPVRITEFSITEEAFDPGLNPIRAKVSLGLRVLSVNDLPSSHRGHSIFLAHQQQKERLRDLVDEGNLEALGLTSLP